MDELRNLPLTRDVWALLVAVSCNNALYFVPNDALQLL